jgi:hypothetical protein
MSDFVVEIGGSRPVAHLRHFEGPGSTPASNPQGQALDNASSWNSVPKDILTFFDPGVIA